MAEENKPEADAQEGGKSSKKLIIIIAIAVVLAVALSVGVTVYLLSGDDEPSGEDVVAEDVTPAKPQAHYFDIKQPFLVTFNVDGRQRYMQVSMSVVSRDPSSFGTMEFHMPLLMSRLNNLYGSGDFNVLKTEAGKLELQANTLKVINELLEKEGVAPVENVYFTNFVLQ